MLLDILCQLIDEEEKEENDTISSSKLEAIQQELIRVHKLAEMEMSKKGEISFNTRLRLDDLEKDLRNCK